MYNFFQEGNLAGLQLKNKLVFPAVNTNLSNEKGELTQDLLNFYNKISKAGPGLIIVGPVRVDRETGVFNKKQLEASDLSQIKELKKLSHLVQENGAKIFLQLQHPGFNKEEGLKDISHRQIQVLVNRFSIAAKITQEAQIDGVEIQAGHGHLFSQFMSPRINKRTDKYGGNIYNNLNFLGETIKGIQEFCTADYPIIVKMNANDFLEGGLNLDQAIQSARIIESFGVHALSISGGSYEALDKILEDSKGEEGWMTPMIKEIKQAVSLPIIASNNIRTPRLAHEMIGQGIFDFPAICRSQLADIDWISKAYHGRDEEIIKCKSCLKCIENSRMGGEIACLSK